MDLIATKSLAYACKRYEAGDKFEANNRDARILVAIGKAKVAEAPKPEPVEPVEEPREEKPGKRSYKRRDMRAE